MAVILGNDFLMKVKKSGETSYTTIGASRTCEIDTSTEFVEVTGPNVEGWKEFVPKRSEWNGSVSCLVTDKPARLWGIFYNKELVSIQFTDENGISWNGSAYVSSIKVGAPINQLSTFKVSLKGTGALTLE